jgi:hypothetical protein
LQTAVTSDDPDDDVVKPGDKIDDFYLIDDRPRGFRRTSPECCETCKFSQFDQEGVGDCRLRIITITDPDDTSPDYSHYSQHVSFFSVGMLDICNNYHRDKKGKMDDDDG